MKQYFGLFLSTVFLFTTPAITCATEVETEYKNMEQMLGSIRLEKKQVESMVDKLVASGRISSEDASKAKRELASMKDEDLENLKLKAVAEVKNKKMLDH
ncbi:MAG: hypothetical protein ACXVLQ_17855 [Bacteriovorax sp.]